MKKTNLTDKMGRILMGKRHKTLQILGWLCTTIFFLSGCLSEDSDCYKTENCLVSFSFTYDFNKHYEDRFTEHVSYIDLFIYDKNGDLYKQCQTSRENMETLHTIQITDLPAGNYTAVSWGNCDDPNFEYTGIEKLDSHKLFMNCIEDGEMTVKKTGSLYHAISNFTVKKEEEKKTVPMDIVKNSNLLRIIIKGMKESDRIGAEQILYARVESSNSAYFYDNTLASPEVISYLPSFYNQEEEDGDVIIEFYVLKLSADDTDTKITLRYRDSDSRLHYMEELIIPNLLTQFITPLEGRSNQPVIGFDEYISRYDEFDLYFEMEYKEGIDGEVAITLKLWDGVNQSGNL